jgi:hypothetical protein|nr:MAG TPA: hypothetical protein [Caudoviricetes sp.]
MAEEKKKNTKKDVTEQAKEEELLQSVLAQIPKEDEDVELNEEDLKNRREILMTFHFDPFEKESNKDKKQLYRDLVSMITDDLAEDLPKARAAISLVRGYLRADRLTDAVQLLSRDAQTMVVNSKALKTLSEMLKNENAILTTTVRDFGLSDRYATMKSKGAGTIGAIVRDIETYDYDDGKVNRYDIKTSASMEQAAEISTKAIMKQLSLSEAEYVDMLKRQREEIEKLHKENDELKEEVRIIYKQIKKQSLLKELATELISKGIGKEEVESIINSNIKFDDEILEKENKKLAKKK